MLGYNLSDIFVTSTADRCSFVAFLALVLEKKGSIVSTSWKNTIVKIPSFEQKLYSMYYILIFK